MAGRRAGITRDRRRNSLARKRTAKATIEHQRQQAEIWHRLWERARAEAGAEAKPRA